MRKIDALFLAIPFLIGCVSGSLTDQEIVDKAVEVSLIAAHSDMVGLLKNRPNSFRKEEIEFGIDRNGRKRSYIREDYGVFASSLDLNDDKTIIVPFSWAITEGASYCSFSFLDLTHLKLTFDFPTVKNEVYTIVVEGTAKYGEATATCSYTLEVTNETL